MIPYFIMFAIVVVLAAFASNYQQKKVSGEIIVNNNNQSYLILMSIITIILICFVGFRYNTGADFGNYTRMYLFRKEKPLSEILWIDDSPINNIIIKICKFIYDDPATYFFIYALVPISLQLSQIKKYNCDVVFCMCIYFLSGPFIGNMNAMRQYLAASILFFSHNYMIEKKFFKYCLAVLLASLCHTTALIMLPIYFLSNLKINLKTISLILLIIVIMRYSYDLFFSIMGVAVDDLDRFSYHTTEVNTLRVLVMIAPVLFYFIFASKNKYSQRENFYLIMMFINAAFMISTSGSTYLARIGLYTQMYSGFYYPLLLKGFDYKNKNISKILIVGFFLFYFYTLVQTANLGNYSTIFSY